MKVVCSRPSCKHEWEYKGQSRHKATCPMCRKIVNLQPAKRVS